MGRPKKSFRSFEEARAFIRALGLKNQKEWHQWCKTGNRPTDIPTAPGMVYKDDGWKGLKNFMGVAVAKVEASTENV